MTRSEPLLAWYDAEQRPLPWRDTSDPYRVLVSEVMAQQTQVSRVIPHYQRFLGRFPTVEALSQANLEDVLAEWSGLGYNRRAVNLREAARRIARNGWPETVAGLEKLPGVGPYTAAAVACFAFGVPVPAVDTNLRRVLARWIGRELSTAQARTVAFEEIDRDRAGDWNQAMMDLGARICSPRSPQCRRCPVAASCTDSSVYSPPPPQGVFAGSAREARGAVLKALITGGTATVETLAQQSGLGRDRVTAALAALEAEAMVAGANGVFSIAS